MDAGGTTADARIVDAGGAADARQIDAAPTADARPPVDAPPAFDARPPVDASTIDAPPPVVVDAGFDAPPACVSDPACSAAGAVCVDGNTTGTCTEVQTGCFQVTAQADCVGSQVCNAGACVCPPAAGNVVGGACDTAQTQTCSDDGRAVLSCVSDAQACLVWTVRDPAADQCNLADGTGDGLTCESNQCVCPVNNTSIFYANPAVDRSARPGLVRNGRRFPAICSFDTMTLALAAASSPDFALTGIAVAASDDPAVPGAPAVFDAETFPWIIPTGRIMTSTDDPVSGVGGAGAWAPQNFVVVVNNDTGPDQEASINVQGANNRATRGGSLRGLTFVEGTCGSDTCDLPSVAIDIEDHGLPASTFSALNFVVVEGGGGAFSQGEEDGVLAGTITAAVAANSVTLSISDNATAFNGLAASDGYFVGVTGSADPLLNGFFLVESFTDGDTLVVRNPDAAAGGTFAGTVTLIGAHDWTTGIRVQDSNATLANLVVRNFATFNGGNRVGLAVESDFGGNPASGEADVVAIAGGRYYLNDVGVAVDGPDGDDLNVTVGPSGASPTRFDNNLAVGLVAANGSVAVTSAVVQGTSGDGTTPGIGILVTGADVATNGVSSTGNATDGLAYESGTLIDTGSSFATNGEDGVFVGGGINAKPQPVDPEVELRGTALTDNAQHGLNVSGAVTVWVRGGAITLNDADGINVSAEDATLVTNASTTGVDLDISTNDLAGVRADEGDIQLNDTNILGNGVADICPGSTDEVDHTMAVIIEGNATLTAVGITVSNNTGGGIEIGTDNENTIAGSTISNNLSVDTCGSGETDPSSGAGVAVLASSNLQFVTSGSNIDGNVGVGLYVAGTVNEPATGAAPFTILANRWTGLFVASTGSVTHTGGLSNSNGTDPQGTTFNDGAHIEGAYSSTNTTYALNSGDGVIVNIADATAAVAMLTFPRIRGNTGNGVTVLGAGGSGAAEVDSLTPVSDAQYGFVVRTNPGSAENPQIFSNGGDGISLGSASQSNEILAKISDVSIHHNTGVGIRVQQHAAQLGQIGAVPAVPCTGGATGCTGVTILSNDVFANTGGGINLRTAFIKRLVGGSEQRGFAANDIFHNALNTCGGPQTAAQIVIAGPTALPVGVCAGKTETTCPAQNVIDNPSNENPDFNNQCLFSGGQCLVAWDLSPGATDADCSAANRFRDYNREGAPDANLKGAIFATQSAAVIAQRNSWAGGAPAQGVDFNVSGDPNTVVRATPHCDAIFTCQEPPPPPAQ